MDKRHFKVFVEGRKPDWEGCLL